MFLRNSLGKQLISNLLRRHTTGTDNLRKITLTATRLTTPKTDINLSNEKLQEYLESLRKEFYALRVSPTGNATIHERINRLDGIVSSLEQLRVIKGNMIPAGDIDKETDEDMKKLMQEENEVYSDLKKKMEQKLISQLYLLADNNIYPAVIFEINAGAGGQEAMLFAKQLFEMYTKYFDSNGWDYTILDEETTDIGGLRHANIIVDEPQAYTYLRYEAGVHRVQRVPATEKSGRIHTSTASVTVIPKPADANVFVTEKDLKIETKRASGAGGQHVNTTDSAVRVVHLPTGIAVESQTERSQLKNRLIAIKRLQAKLLQMHLDSTEANTQATRKAQQGNRDRNEKIRTYNFVQDRITDHRIPDGTMHNLQELLQGGQSLHRLIERIVTENRKTMLTQMIINWNNGATNIKETAPMKNAEQ